MAVFKELLTKTGAIKLGTNLPVERPMLVVVENTHPALKHGGYSATTILPGEDAAAFEKLHRDLIAELSPKGVLEEDIVAELAHLMWRKQNLAIFGRAERARERREAIRSQRAKDTLAEKNAAKSQLSERLRYSLELNPAEREAAAQAADELARAELGEDYELAKIAEVATVDHLLRNLAVQDRLDAMIDKCLKRLLFVRGLKSLPAASPQPTQQPPALPGPSKAA
jgi:hypothetical protein